MYERVVLVVGSALVAAYNLKSTCSVCDSKLTWNEDCVVDRKPVCADCGISVDPVLYDNQTISDGGRCCKAHLARYEEKLQKKRTEVDDNNAAVAKLLWARTESVNVKTWPKTYKGVLPAPKLGKLVSTERYDDKEEALTQLKMIAVLNGCSHVQQVEQFKGVGEDGNFKFAVWEASGVI
jgi:hypothetical protein